jgi:hypothetical protein
VFFLVIRNRSTGGSPSSIVRARGD